MLSRVGERLKVLGVKLVWSDEALNALARLGFDPDYGARPLRRAIRTRVEDPAAELLLSGSVSGGDTLLVDGAGDTLTLAKQEVEKENEPCENI